MLPPVEFTDSATRALGIEHTPFEGNFGFSLEEPHCLMFNIRPSISASQDASELMKLLHESHALVRLVLQLHKDEMQGRSKPSTARTLLEETR
jgi:hypothetical protein